MTPLLSIIIPCFNSAVFLEVLVNSLIAQCLEDCEVIIVNDGSTDDTLKIAKLFENEQIHIFEQENKGVSAARNLGLENASGKYLLFLDSDDALPDGTLDYYRNLLKKIDSEILAFGYEKIQDGRKHFVTSIKFSENVVNGIDFLQLFLIRDISFHLCSSIYKREFLLNNKIAFPFGIKVGEDFAFMLEAMKCAKNCFYSPRICFSYRIRQDSAMLGYKRYSYDVFNSFIINYHIALKILSENSIFENNANFYIVNSYCAQLIQYLKSKDCDNDINNAFIFYKKVLNRKFKVKGKIRKRIIFVTIKILPISSILKIIKYNKNSNGGGYECVVFTKIISCSPLQTSFLEAA